MPYIALRMSDPYPAYPHSFYPSGNYSFRYFMQNATYLKTIRYKASVLSQLPSNHTGMPQEYDNQR